MKLIVTYIEHNYNSDILYKQEVISYSKKELPENTYNIHGYHIDMSKVIESKVHTPFDSLYTIFDICNEEEIEKTKKDQLIKIFEEVSRKMDRNYERYHNKSMYLNQILKKIKGETEKLEKFKMKESDKVIYQTKNKLENVYEVAGEVKLVLKPKPEYKNRKIQITKSEDIANFLQEITKDIINTKEAFYLICLNRANYIANVYKVSEGGISGTIVDPKLVFATALGCLSSSIILAHNHPSGNFKPSQADIDLTKKLIKAGNNLDIIVLDHIIYTDSEYYSFADEGLM